MKLTKKGKYYVWIGNYESKDFPKEAGFYWYSGIKNKWAPKTDEIPPKTWWTTDSNKAVKLVDYADSSCKDELLQLKEKNNKNLLASIATDADVKIPAPKGLDYYPYQKAGIRYAINNDNVLIADEMGLGKTIQAIGTLNYIEFNKVIIVCPASLKLNWIKELETWLIKDVKIVELNSNSKEEDANIYVINYDILHKDNFAWLRNIKYDVCIADEVHYAKNAKTKRAKALYGLSAKKKIYLTGTPILNRPIELYPIISNLGFKMSYWNFATRYCDLKRTRFGIDVSGSSNLEELQLRLRQTCMIRRMKKDVLTELPPKTRQIIYLNPDKYQSYIDAEHNELENISKLKKLSYIDAIERLHEFTARDISIIAKLRHELALAKLPDVFCHIDSILEHNKKIIIFAHHRDVIDAICEKYNNISVKLYGGMSNKNKNESVEKFQNNDDIKLFVGSIQAAGVGLTLTAANIVLFVELDWVPANLTQAEDRIHRIGQSKNVLVQHIVVDGSIDATLAKKIVEKQNIADRALNIARIDEFKAHQEHKKNELIKSIQEMEKRQRQHLEDLQRQNAKRISELQAKRKQRDKVDGIPEYTNAQKNIISKKLKALSMKIDGRGFNPKDASFGHSLANVDVLSNRQCHYAIKLLRNYYNDIDTILK